MIGVQCDPYRDWKRPSAAKRHERNRAKAEKNHAEQVEKVFKVLTDTIGRYKTIVARGEHNLLLTLANVIGFRLYEEDDDIRRSGSGKYRQGERQQIMRDALKLIIERNVAKLHPDANDEERLTLRVAHQSVSPMRQSPKWTLIIDGEEIHNYIPDDDEVASISLFDDESDEESEIVLSDRLASKLRRVKEPIFT